MVGYASRWRALARSCSGPRSETAFAEANDEKLSSIAAVRLTDEAPPHVAGMRSLAGVPTLRVNPNVTAMRLLPDFHAADATASEGPSSAAPLHGSPPSAARPGRAWVPIRSLGPRHRERIVAHLVLLDERSRYLRFGYAASDAQISRYVDTIDF